MLIRKGSMEYRLPGQSKSTVAIVFSQSPS
ncbi:hypothetical protein AZE42_08079 [Rhizopogon vesiculosus]|uniref:Uncharacterized protein n=1 Tax=Rhizopogon vesiculosus TaxID=180088 RepID=A0A1J8QJ74_9AGAM|nr:hypothetical protein AZE42_08079 [Rhizopogon vesiculosus]